jgi:hypothetical protein
MENKCGSCGERVGTGERSIYIPGLGLLHFGGCPSKQLSEDEARVVHEIEDHNVLIHVRAGGLL